MSTALVSGRGGMNRSHLIAGMLAMMAQSPAATGNVIEIKARPDDVSRAVTPFKLPGMSPRDYARYRGNCGHPKRTKNRFHCARKAKVARRR